MSQGNLSQREVQMKIEEQENVEAYFSAFKGLKIFIEKIIYMNFEKELSSMRRRLENITVIDPPT